MRWRWAAAAALAGWAAAPAHAACYTFVNGRYIERPCDVRTAGLDSSELNRYLSPPCATLNDGIRAAVQQRNYNRAMDLRNEFVSKCGDELSDAAKQNMRERDDARQQHADRRAQAEQSQAQQRAQADQCAAMRDVIQSRRKRIDSLNENDLAALRQFEGSYNERCLR